MAETASDSRLTPFKITLIYVAFGIFWLLSDSYLKVFFADPIAFERFSTTKGWSLLGITAFFLYRIVQRHEEELDASQHSLGRMNRAHRALSACSQALVRNTEEEELMKEVCRIIVECGGYRLAWVAAAQHDEEKRVLPVAQWGFEEGFLNTLNLTWADTERGQGPTGHALRSGQPYVVQQIQTSPNYELWRDETLKRGYAASIALPLLEDGHPFGVLNIYAAEPDAFDPDEVELLEELSRDLAYGVVTLRLQSAKRQTDKAHKVHAAVLEQSPLGIILYGTDGSINYVNASFERLSGYDRMELVGRDGRILANNDRNEAFFRSVTDVFSYAEDRRAKLTFLARNDARQELDAVFSPVRNELGSIISYAAVLRDMTHEVELERQLLQAQKMEAIGTLAGGIAHDFKNILGAIITATEMTLTKLPPGSGREMLEVVLKAAMRGKSLVQQIMAFSRQKEQERQPVRLEQVLRECIVFLRASLPSTIEIRHDLPDGLGAVLADPTQIHQVIFNLCTNSSHAMQEKGGVLEIALSRVEVTPENLPFPSMHSGEYLRITVSDTGHGMSPEVQQHIFDPFFTTKKPGEGTGLGLSVVHGIVKSHGGTITVSSKLGEGTVFQLFFPLLLTVAEGVEPTAIGKIPGGTERILLVDDDEDLVVVVEKMLQSLGYEVLAATSSVAALKKFIAEPGRFDIIITDQTMPQLTGCELATAIRNVRPEMPIILCSGYNDESQGSISPEEVAAVGFREMLPKPVDCAQMAGAIRRALETHK
ncbi:ATP-binding protein [Geomonas sp. RF6]|uniref:ATP-binding protein n=1 Tax=Geomonas sp. RF6 TaxID=2897342 RepID=UPI001E4FFD93|nr:ATP-binding protein [Geomonas sp. RF6]UFS71413.1 ATP-binding protein [Geomonas sp. RF6]